MDTVTANRIKKINGIFIAEAILILLYVCLFVLTMPNGSCAGDVNNPIFILCALMGIFLSTYLPILLSGAVIVYLIKNKSAINKKQAIVAAVIALIIIGINARVLYREQQIKKAQEQYQLNYNTSIF